MKKLVLMMAFVLGVSAMAHDCCENTMRSEVISKLFHLFLISWIKRNIWYISKKKKKKKTTP